ncbi:hypothetical protein Tco_1062088 [Tanacetum coccineum]
MSSSTVTYTSVYSGSEPWRFQWVSDDELEAPEEAPQSSGQEPPSPNYVPGPEHPPSPDYVPGSEEPEQALYLSLTLSLGYVTDSDLEEDIEEDPEEDPAEYPADGGDDNDDDEEEEDEEEEHLALADSTALYIVDPVSLAEDT